MLALVMVSSSTTAAVITRSAPTPRLSVVKVRQRRWLFFFHQLAAKRRRRVPNYRRHLLRRRHLRRRGDHLREQRGVRAPPHDDDDDDDYEDFLLSFTQRARVYRLLFLWKNLSRRRNFCLLTKVLFVSSRVERVRVLSAPLLSKCSLSVSLSQNSLGLDKVFCLKKVYLKSKEEKHARTPSHRVLLSL